MLYVIKDNYVYMKVSGNYSLEDYKDYFVVEDERTNLVWNNSKQKLEEESTEPPKEYDPGEHMPRYHKLADLMRETELWARILEDGEKSLKLNVAVTLLIASVTTTENVADLKSSLKKYFKGLEDSKSAKVFSTEELVELQDYLNQTKFNSIQLKDL